MPAFKGAVGTASRKLSKSLGDIPVGVLVQTNFSGVLSIGGAPDIDRAELLNVRSNLSRA
jgi:L-aminopeptidase/D-esterase-like protein